MNEAVNYTAENGGIVQTFTDGSLWIEVLGYRKSVGEMQVETLREFFEWEKEREEERTNPAFEHGEVWRITYDDGTEIVANIEIGVTGHIYLVNDYLNVYFGIGTRDNPGYRDGIVSYERVQAA